MADLVEIVELVAMAFRPAEERLAGICIGGPRDGDWIEGRERRFTVPIALTAIPLDMHSERAQNLAYATFRYRWQGTPHGVGFWWPEDERMTADALFKALISGYRRPKPADG